uniref:Pre-mRNA-splicing factor SLU7 n=1 Tax=Strix occidentalis caurina TaxID=311401 RepID=A0A8D0EPR8_STROC
MSSVTNATPSGGSNDVSLEEPKKMTREDWRKKKELEEQRKLGNAPAEVDEEGKDINPHIPQYISSVPWYIDPSKRPTLKHQRPQPEKQKQYSTSGDWYKRGVQEHAIATRYRKGACENCGALTHKKKDCMERPRKVGAKYTGMNIAPDEHVQPQLMFDYDGKRDRWNGYNPEEHMKIVEEYSKVDLAKRTLKAQKLQEELASGKLEQVERDHNSEDEDEDKYADDIDMPGQNFDSKRRITVRNLRIREDIAKYLRNLDPNSAYYDPKTRAMRENPYANTGKNPDEVGYAGDNFVRYTGDTISMAQTQLFAWEAYDKGSEVHLQADPTKLELLYKSFKVKKEDFKAQQKESILEKVIDIWFYLVRILLCLNSGFWGTNKITNIYKNIFISIHSSCIWGSYWKEGKWGYKCCHSFVKYSYCTGEAGKEIAVSIVLFSHLERTKNEWVSFLMSQPGEEEHMTKPKTLMEIHQEKQKEKKKKKHKKSSNSDSEGEEKKKQEKLKKALNAEEARLLHVKEIMQLDERKRPYNSLYETREPSEEEMEAYRMKRQRPDDPMASFLGQ